MSFASILKTVENIAIGVETVAAPVAETIFPQFAGPIASIDGIFHRLQGSLAQSQAANPAGVPVYQSVINDFEAGLELTQYILSQEGKQMTYDPTALKAAITASDAAFQAFAALKTSFKVAPLPGGTPIAVVAPTAPKAA